MEFQDRLRIGHMAKDLVIEALTNAGYNVWSVGNHPTKGRYVHVDFYVTGEHRFWVDVKARKLSGRYLPYMYSSDMEWLVDWHIKTRIPPFIVFALYEDEVKDSTLHIISLYKARNKAIDLPSGRRLIKTKDMMPLEDWVVKVRGYPDKWRGVV